MDGDQRLWQAWIAGIRHWGLELWIATLLESMASFTFLGAQLLYLVNPLFHRTVLDEHLAAAANVLEDPNLVRDFVRLLREGSGT